MTPDDLRRWRRELRLSQPFAARVLGITARTVGAYEQGQLPIPQLVALACAAVMAGLAPYAAGPTERSMVKDILAEARQVRTGPPGAGLRRVRGEKGVVLVEGDE